MPARDQSGPYGNGPEGRGMGPCKEEVPGGGPGFGRRSGRRGGGYSNRRSGYNRRSEFGQSENVINAETQSESVLTKILDRLDDIEKRLKD